MPIIRIVHDEDPSTPREWDNLGVMACWHRSYKLGDEPYNLWTGTTPREFLDKLPKGSIVLPLYLYDHSGITISTGAFSCLWDSGQVGWIVATPEAIRKAFMCKRITKKIRKRAEDCLKREVQIYDHYITGNVWGYILEDESGEYLDSCYGFYGSNIEETGLLEHLAPKYHEVARAAWNNRGT